ncbi:MAG: MFS transporter [Lachnospiraceae bacterium]|nr:MFS transporter [Lachnospiraceae bacterium]
MEKKSFFASLGKRKLGVVLNLFYAYMSLGLVLIMLGAILPDLKADYALSYQVGGALLSVQSVGYVLAGLLAGYLPLLIGIKISFILIQLAVTLGFIMLLISGNPIWLLAAMFLIGIGKGGITNYNNLLMSLYSEGNAGPLNILHACFAAGAVIAPLIVLVVSGWRMAVLTGCIVCAASLVFLSLAGFSDKDLQTGGENQGNGDGDGKSRESHKKVDYGFFREKIFWVTVLIVFFYQAVEASFMGWLTSFLIDTGLMEASLAQFTTSVLWMALMAGRLICSLAAARFKPSHMILALTCITAIFMIVLLQIKSPAGLIIATAGIGLGMSGMFGTSVSNAGDIFSRYPVCMGFFVFLTCMGAIVAPAVIGLVANGAGMHAGMSTLLIFAGCMIAMAVVNVVMQRKR